MRLLHTIKQQLSDPYYQSLVNNIDSYFADSHLVLQDDRNKIKEIEFNQEKLIVKSFKIPTLINRFVYTYFRKSKASRAYEFGLKIAQFTPKVIAYVEYYDYYLLSKSYFICEKFDFDFDIRYFLLDKTLTNRDIILKQFAEFIFELHQNSIIHQDLSPGNILIKKNGADYIFQIVDINRMIFKKPSPKERAENFSKLWADDEDLSLILKTYANLSAINTDNFIRWGLKFSQKHKERKIIKRKIKMALGL